MTDSRRTRRAVLSGIGVATGLGIAGCLRLADEDTDSNGGQATGENEGSDETDPEDPSKDPTAVTLESRWDLENVVGIGPGAIGGRILDVVDGMVYSVDNDWLLGIDPSEPRLEREISFEDVLTGPSERTNRLAVDEESLYLTTDLSEVEPDEEREESSKVYRFGADGGVLWSHEIPDEAEWIDAIAVADDHVLVASFTTDDGESAFEVLDADGTVRFSERWSEEVLFRDIVVSDDTAYIGNGMTFDFDSWELSAPPDSNRMWSGSLTLANDDLYSVAPRSVRSYALDANEERFETDIDEGTAAPAVTDTVVVAASQTGIYGFDRETGEERWHVRTTDSVYEPVVILDGVAYALDESHIVYGVDVETGEVVYDDEAPLSEAGLLRVVPDHDLLVFAGRPTAAASQREGLLAVEPVPES